MGVEAAFVLEEMSVAACPDGAVLYDRQQHGRDLPCHDRCWMPRTGDCACMDTEVGGSFG